MEIAALICNEDLDYESTLQIYSMFQFIRKSGNEIQIIDYNFLNENIKNYFLKLKNNMLYTFLENNTILTVRRYSSLKQLQENIPLADEYIIANAKYKDLGIFPKEETLIYGIKDANKYEIDLIKDEYEKFSSLSDIKDEQVKRVVDPLFLLSKDEWNEFSQKSSISESIKDYILVYGKVVTKDMLSYAKKLSEINNCKIYIVADKINTIIYKGKKLNNVSPLDLVRLISNSNDIVTSSDEAIKFSVLFNKNVHIFTEEEKYDSQIEIINELKLLDRIVISPERVILKENDSSDVVESINELRAESIKFLK